MAFIIVSVTTVLVLACIAFIIYRRRTSRDDRQDKFKILAKTNNFSYQDIEQGLLWKIDGNGYTRNIVTGVYKGHTIKIADVYLAPIGSIVHSYVGTKILSDDIDIDAANDKYVKIEPEQALQKIDEYLSNT